MKRCRFQYLLVFSLGLGLLAGCEDLRGGEIDPAGHLSRNDYLDLCHREDSSTGRKTEKIANNHNIGRQTGMITVYGSVAKLSGIN